MNSDYSERRYYTHGGYHDHDDFRARDFQCCPGGISVIDPELFREVYDKTNKSNREWNACLLITYVFFVSVCLSFAFADGDNYTFVIYFPISGIAISFVVFCTCDSARKIRGALIDPYKSCFLEAYGIEIGYGEWQTGTDSENGRPIYSYGMYLRRQRISTEEEALEEANDRTDIADEDFAPIFLNQFIPGDISIDMMHDVTSMKIDAETWNILQSTHESVTEAHMWVMAGTFAMWFLSTDNGICCLVGVCFFCLWLCVVIFSCAVIFSWYWKRVCGALVLMAGPSLLLPAYWVISDRIFARREKNRRHRACKETAKLVTENMLDAKDGKVWIVDFHTSDLPGREREYSERYVLSTREKTRTGDDPHTGNQDMAPLP